MIMIEPKDIGKRIKDARKLAKMSQSNLSKRTEISTTQISAYENGNKSIGLQTLAKIAMALDTTIDELYFGNPIDRNIKNWEDKGDVIVRCVHILYKEGVIVSKERFSEDYDSNEVEYYYRIGFGKYIETIDQLVNDLHKFEDEKEYLETPQSFEKQLLELAAKKINVEIEATQNDKLKEGKYEYR